jgi:hypothetical protein
MGLEVEVRHAAMTPERGNMEVTIPLHAGVLVLVRRGLAQRCGEALLGVLVGDRRVEVGHHPPVARAAFHLRPADVDVHRRRARVVGVNDGREGGRRAQRLARLVVVVHVRNVDRHAVEHRGLDGRVAHAAAVAPAVAQPRDRFERLLGERFEPEPHALLQLLDQADG